MIVKRYIKVLQKDIVTKPEKWKDAGPGKFIKLSNKAKNVYAVLSVIAFSYAGNAEGKNGNGTGKLGKDWFWTSHAILKRLTGMGQKTVQRGIKELHEEGFIDYNPARKIDHQCFFKIKRITYNNSSGTDFIDSGTRELKGSASKKKYSEDDDKNILDMYKRGEYLTMTRAQRIRFEEMKKQIGEAEMSKFRPQNPNDDGEVF